MRHRTWLLLFSIVVASHGALATTCSAPDSLRIASDHRTLSWTRNGAGGTFDVVHGDLGSLLASAGSFKGASCIASGLAKASTSDPVQPAVQAATYELARCHGDTWNDGTQIGTRDASIVACP